MLPIVGLVDDLQNDVSAAQRRQRVGAVSRQVVCELAPFDFLIQTIQALIRMSNKQTARVDLFRGTLDVMILQTLEMLGPLHGYAISARLEQVSGGALQLNMGTLYPGLMRLEQRGFVRGRWGVTDSNRRARFYELTPRGRRQLADERHEWDRMAAIMNVLFQREG